MARTFKDKAGREWTIALTIGKARDVLDKVKVDLLQPEAGNPPLPEVLADDYKVAQILEVLLASEFKRLGVDPANVMDTDWDGKTTRYAYDAFLAELSCFFEARGQSPRAQIIRKTQEAIVAGMVVVGERVAAMDPAAEVRKRVAEFDERQTAGNGSGLQQVELASRRLT